MALSPLNGTSDLSPDKIKTLNQFTRELASKNEEIAERLLVSTQDLARDLNRRNHEIAEELARKNALVADQLAVHNSTLAVELVTTNKVLASELVQSNKQVASDLSGSTKEIAALLLHQNIHIAREIDKSTLEWFSHQKRINWSLIAINALIFMIMAAFGIALARFMFY